MEKDAKTGQEEIGEIRGQVSGRFDVNQGGFRQFKYETLGGTVSYEGPGITLDTRLQQNPTQWFTAKGYVPGRQSFKG